jgi:nucleotide-binding universal stress UspA family protein
MKIMLGYDGSNAAKDALELSVKHAKAFGARLYIIRSLVGGANDEAERIEKANRDLAYAESFCKERGVSFESHLLVRGLSPAEDLIQFAEEKAVDEIVIGVRRRSNVGKMVFGSNARDIILNAPCPVVTVK